MFTDGWMATINQIGKQMHLKYTVKFLKPYWKPN